MKLLIAVASCNRDINNGFNNAVRETWFTRVPQHVAAKFFVGDGSATQCDDEVLINCPDDYLSLPHKTRAIMQWALARDYTHVFKCDSDTYVNPPRMLASSFSRYDYVGHFNGLPPHGQVGKPNVIYDHCWSWASGGAGYWLSAKAAQLLVASPPDERAICPRLKYPCEDFWVGSVLGPQIRAKRITAKHDTRYGRSYRDDYRAKFTAHFCSEGMQRTFDVAWLRQHFEVNK